MAHDAGEGTLPVGVTSAVISLSGHKVHFVGGPHDRRSLCGLVWDGEQVSVESAPVCCSCCAAVRRIIIDQARRDMCSLLDALAADEAAPYSDRDR